MERHLLKEPDIARVLILPDGAVAWEARAVVIDWPRTL